MIKEVMTTNPDLKSWLFVGLKSIFANDAATPRWEIGNNMGNKTAAFDTLPVEKDWRKNGKLIGLVGQIYGDWGYDTTQMNFDLIVNGAIFESFTNSDIDIETIKHVDAMAMAWETIDFTEPLPPPLTIH